MTIAAEATAAKHAALVVEFRRCLAFGVSPSAQYIKDAIAQLENATTADTSGRTDIAPDNVLDGRSAAEAAVIA